MNGALMTLTEQVVSSNDKLAVMLNQVRDKTICLVQETYNFVQPEIKLSFTLINVDTVIPAGKKDNRDIYPSGDGGYILHLGKQKEIAQAAGIKITDSRIMERKVDAQGRVLYISHQVKWTMQGIDGSLKEGTATGKYDYARDVEKYPSTAQVKARRSHAEGLAESNAIWRANAQALGKLPQVFSLEELKSKPILVPCVIEDKEELIKQLPPDVQVEMRKAHVAHRLGISDSIYGKKPEAEEAQFREVETGSAGFGSAQPPQPPQPEERPRMTMTPAPLPSGIKPPQPPQPPPATLAQETPEPQDEDLIRAEEFRSQSQDARTKCILTLIGQKAWKPVDPSTVLPSAANISQVPVDRQIQFIYMLYRLPNVQGGLPF